MSATLAVDHAVAASAAPTARTGSRPSVLVAIASYGTAQDHFLSRVVAGFRELDMDCRVVVLSNIDKPVPPGSEVRVGLPSSNTYSLPFAHRRLFIECAGQYDLYIYTEDDTPLSAANVRAFLETQRHLRDDEIAGFLRSEIDSSGDRVVVSANSHFRWLPDSVFTRSDQHFASFSNQHSGCFIVTKSQLDRAIASGGFTTEARSGRYGMLETAASDIYTQCGLKRVICLSRIDDFIVPHLANKYFHRMGIPLVDFKRQVAALREIESGADTAASLVDPATKAPGFRWSKNLYRPRHEAMLALLPGDTRRLLSVGATMGHDELALRARGIEVVAVPLDAVFGATLRHRGIEVHTAAIAELAGAGFDAVLAPETLHLMADPVASLRAMRSTLARGGCVVGAVANTDSWYWTFKDWKAGRERTRPDFERFGAQPMSERRLTALCDAAGFELDALAPDVDDAPALTRVPLPWLRRKLAPWLLCRATRIETSR